MKRLTIGVTTHNEKDTINGLLNCLSKLDQSSVDIIVFDDASTDGTPQIIEGHPLSRQSNFHGEYSSINHGTPSAGRTYIGQRSTTEYTTLIDGDDKVDVSELNAVLASLPGGYDLILSCFKLRGKIVRLSGATGEIDVQNDSILRLLSGIAGKIYRTELLEEFGADPVRGRSDDVRLNMRILLSGQRRIFQFVDRTFYIVEESRKSARVSSINFDEVRDRVQNYIKLQALYGIDRRYLAALKRNLRKVIREDHSVDAREKSRLHQMLDTIFKFELKRVVFIGGNLNSIGGIPVRLKRTLDHARGRSVEYFVFGTSGGSASTQSLSTDKNLDEMIGHLKDWSNSDTVFITANNLLRALPLVLKKQIEKFPLVFMFSGQMSFIVQDTTALANPKYVRDLKASRIISFSDIDISFQRQLGITGQVKGFIGVETRSKNEYSATKSAQFGYVGRIDFHTKNCMFLLEIAKCLREMGLPPLSIFTTDAENSPDYEQFLISADEAGIRDHLSITVGCTDRDLIYREIGCLVLPSVKESFGNVILEAYSYGIPVVGYRYAPGPSELILDGETGFLLDELTSADFYDLIDRMGTSDFDTMSQSAFRRHQMFSMSAYLEFIESTCANVLHTYYGKNELNVMPALKLIADNNKVEKKAISSNREIRVEKNASKYVSRMIKKALKSTLTAGQISQLKHGIDRTRSVLFKSGKA